MACADTSEHLARQNSAVPESGMAGAEPLETQPVYRGVRRLLHEDLWLARVFLPSGRRVSVGYYPSAFEAARAYDRELLRIIGAKSVKSEELNFPVTEYQADKAEVEQGRTRQEKRKARGEGPALRPSKCQKTSADTQAEGTCRAISTKSIYRESSKFRGVVFCKASDLWQARMLMESGQILCLGSFQLELEAAKAYDRRAVRLFGDKAQTNLPVEEYMDELQEYWDERDGLPGYERHRRIQPHAREQQLLQPGKQDLPAYSPSPPQVSRVRNGEDIPWRFSSRKKAKNPRSVRRSLPESSAPGCSRPGPAAKKQRAAHRNACSTDKKPMSNKGLSRNLIVQLRDGAWEKYLGIKGIMQSQETANRNDTMDWTSRHVAWSRGWTGKSAAAAQRLKFKTATVHDMFASKIGKAYQKQPPKPSELCYAPSHPTPKVKGHQRKELLLHRLVRTTPYHRLPPVPKVKKTLRKGLSKYRGVTFHQGRWKAQVVYGNAVCHIGLFKSESEAAAAFDREVVAIWGKAGASVVNFPISNYNELLESPPYRQTSLPESSNPGSAPPADYTQV